MSYEPIGRHPLAACAVAALFCASFFGYSPRAVASTIAVTNCNDSGTGSLRSAAARARSGDTLDLRRLHCTIVLTRGQVELPQQDIALVGPGAGALAITSEYRSRIFLHAGTGTLRIAYLSLVEGRHAAEFATGGCIYSSGNVTLQNARLHQCTAEGIRPPDCEGTGTCSHSNGGAIRAEGVVRMSYSTVSDSHVNDFDSFGGGIYATELRMYRSRLLRNHSNMWGGGALANRLVALGSIIAGNSTYSDGGPVDVGYADVRDSTFTDNETVEGGCTALCAGEARIVNSTFSGNHAGGAGAIWVDDLSLVSSSVTRNREIYGSQAECEGAIRGGSLYIESSIVAGNACGSGVLDVGGFGTLVGAHNLVGVSLVPLPADTLRGDPLLGPLAFNGGVTPTHALRTGSPAIGRGSNPLLLQYDQRGPGFPRVKGAAPDIGAFER